MRIATGTRIAISSIWAIAAAVVAYVTHAEAPFLEMRAFWHLAPVVICAISVYMAAPAIQAAFHRNGESTFLWLWFAVPTATYITLTVVIMGWVAVSEGLLDALAVPVLAIYAPTVILVFPFSAVAASFCASVATVAILARNNRVGRVDPTDLKSLH